MIDPDDFSFYRQIKVPPPTRCPKCRMARRFAWWGYRILYKRKCDFTGKNLITVYHPDVPMKMYINEVWYSDQWDPKEYGRDYDFSRPFFEQFRDLFNEVPRPALHVESSTMVNSDYCNAASELRNCYLVFKSDRIENSGYLNATSFLKECFDVFYANYNELCYESVNINKCYQAFWSTDCDDCHNIWFSKDLVGCSNCLGCINLRNQKYCILNKQYTKEEYEKKLREFDFGSGKNVKKFKKQFDEFSEKHPRRQFHGRQTTNVSGDYLYQCKNVFDSYWVHTAEDIRYSQLLQVPGSKKGYDWSAFGFNSEWVYDSAWVGISSSNVKFSFWNYTAHDLEYSFGCHGSGNLFGCVGLRKGEYCILNKQYTKSDYEKLLPKIKEHMDKMPYIDSKGRIYKYGEFFPSEFSPWAYNESHMLEFEPLDKEEAISRGFLWRDPDEREYQDATTKLPDHIRDVKDDIVKEILKCENCGKNYRVIPIELQFYKRFDLPIPRHCPLCRHYEKTSRLNPIAVYDRDCAKCGKGIKSSYVPDGPEVVYCEQCYQAEVV